MLRHGRYGIGALLASLGIAAADDQGRFSADWVFPAQRGYVKHSGDTMEISYTSNYPNTSLWSFCYNGRSDQLSNLVVSNDHCEPSAALNGTESVSFDKDFASEICWFNIRKADDDKIGSNGPLFAYDWRKRETASTIQLGSQPEVMSFTDMATTAPATATATNAPTSTAASNSTSSNPTNNNVGHNNHKLTPGAIAGIVVAVVLGLAAVVGFAVVVILGKRRRGNSAVSSGTNGKVEASGQSVRQELDAGPLNQQPAELP